MHHALIFNIHYSQGVRPIGAYRIASFLRSEDWDVEVVDWVFHWSLEELKELAISRITDDTIFCGFGVFFHCWPEHVEQFTEWLKERYPNVTLIMGGQAKPKVKYKSIDYIIYGYGENAVLELVRSLINNSSSTPINFDPAYTDNLVIAANNDYPSSPMKSLMIKYEDRDFIRPGEWLNLELSRGCRFKCLFCNFPILGVKGDYSRDAEDLYVHMMDAYDRFGVTNYQIVDETLNDWTGKLEKFANVVDRLPFRPWSNAFIRADLLVSRPEDRELLLRLNVLGHFYGLESTNYESAKTIGKGMHPDKLLPGLLDAKKYFHTYSNHQYRGFISLIVGLPYETRETMNKTFHWLIKNWQGESFGMFPLEIQMDSKTDNLSKLSLDYKKYGYKISEYVEKENDFNTHILSSSKFWWENNEWNRTDCCNLIEEYSKKSNLYDFRLGASAFCHYDKLENLLKKQPPNIFMDWSKQFQIEYRDYIDKKLSL